jgi:predicted AlkP superfamily pyrophosphatase or phosphodiesterase
VYFGLAAGIYMSGDVEGPALERVEPRGSHGFPSVDPDMQPALCIVGPSVRPHRFGTARLIDIAPTVAEWLGIAPPMAARGVSLLREVR